MKTSATNRKIRVLMTDMRDAKLEPRPEFQRRLVWTGKHKENFLRTVLQNYPFPEIYIAAGSVDPNTGEGKEMLVDGQQRITTLHQYFSGSADLVLREIQPYVELTDEAKIEFLEYEVVIRDLGKKSIEEIKEVFRRINSTKYSLNAMEVHNARFDGALKKFSEKLAEHDFFQANGAFKTNDVRRMGDLVFCLTATITILTGYFNRDEPLEEFLSQYNEDFPSGSDLWTQFAQVFQLISSCNFPKASRIWRKADLLTAIIEIHRALYSKGLQIEVADLERNLKEFYETVDAAREDETKDKEAATYYKAALQGTNDRKNRVRRGEAVARVVARAAIEQNDEAAT